MTIMQEYRVNEHGDQFWYQNGLLHRTDAPAVIYANGTQAWYQNDQLRRTDGPAIVYANGDEVWYQHGLLHRTDGPAIVFANGGQRWFLEGHLLSFDVWAERVALTPAAKTFMLLKYCDHVL